MAIRSSADCEKSMKLYLELEEGPVVVAQFVHLLYVHAQFGH